VNDLYCNGKLVSFNVWLSRGAQLVDYLLWRGILDSLPALWKDLLKNENAISNTIQMCTVVYGTTVTNIKSLTEKDVKNFYRHVSYNQLKENEFKAQMKYNAILNLDDLNTWKIIYCNPIEI
jgi:hypothetical protein